MTDSNTRATAPTDMAARLEGLQASAAKLQEKLAALATVDETLPVEAGHDRSGAIEIHLAKDWEQTVPPESLGATITLAVSRLAEPRETPAGAGASFWEVPHNITDTAREINDGIEKVMDQTRRTLESLPERMQVVDQDPPGALIGSNESQTVKIVACDGRFVRCDVNASWAAGKPANTIAMAFSDAVDNVLSLSGVSRLRVESAPSTGPVFDLYTLVKEKLL